MYRRENRERARRAYGAQPESMGHFRGMVIKQTAICITLLIVLIGLKTYDSPDVQLAKNAVQFTVTQTTDVPALWGRITAFWSSLRNGASSPDDDPLTSMEAPVAGAISSGFGMRTHPIEQVEKFHYGVDISGSEGDKIRAANTGEVAEAGSDDANGNYLIIKHNDRIYTFYGHCQKTLPVKGDKVKKGQVIATMGATGQTTGPHLHFEIREGDNSIDPTAFITFEQPQPEPAPAA